jgi:predicted dienelactone hydrolase
MLRSSARSKKFERCKRRGNNEPNQLQHSSADSPQGGKYLLVIEGATHVSFGGKLGRLRGGVDAAGLTKSVSLAFLDAYLKQDVQAKAWLNGQPSTAWLGSQAKLQRKL